MVNAHTHVYSGLVPLMVPQVPRVPRVPFIEILRGLWWKVDRALDARSLRAAARYYVADALAHGTSVLVDHHESPSCIEGSLDVIADVCQALGMPAVLCYGATERNGGADEARRGLAECARFLRDNDRPFVRGVVGLHASFTVSDDTIREAGELCREHGAVLHVHLAEGDIDVDDARRRGYAGPLERLETLGALVSGSILAHGVHLTEAQAKYAATCGCWIVQNPRSNAHNGVGYPVGIRGVSRVALGTDGFPSDMRVERHALQAEGAAHCEDPARLAARLHNGAFLAAQRFGGPIPVASPPPSPEALAAIEYEAREEAQRLQKALEAPEALRAPEAQ